MANRSFPLGFTPSPVAKWPITGARPGAPTEELSDLFQSAPSGFSLEFREALASLPENTRQALLLRYREGFSVGEVAQILGRSYKATESLLSRARALLAQQLKLEK